LIYNINKDLNFLLEYQLEYGIPLDHPFAFDMTARFVTMIGSELPIAAGGDRQKSAISSPSLTDVSG
jgi:hypothetical protein